MNLLITAGAIIVDEDNRILLVLRPADKKIFPNCWALPGGKTEA
ncbi:MAG: NUDIX domain-containing protein [bacterium]